MIPNRTVMMAEGLQSLSSRLTSYMTLALKGCSFECYKEVEAKSCCPGFWGPDCIECPEEASRPCSHNGVCSDGVGGNGTCSCKEGFAGTACEICASGRYGPKCSSVCTCVHGLCNAGLNGDGTCMCFSGYKGPNCNQEVPECAALSCPSNSRCIEEAATGQLACQCMPGYRKDSPNAQSINPCLQRICHAQATCIHTGPNQHMCACNEGYSGDGHVCMAIDPCQTNRGGCSADSTHCVYDEPGKSHCECLSGFKQLVDGVCSLTDVCRPDSCHKNANCSTVAPGRFECTCLQGYVGNGKVCYGNIMQRLNELNTEPGMDFIFFFISVLESLSWPLQNLGPFTVFVPINKAFRGSSVRTLMANQAKAKYLCKMHLVAGVMPFETLKKTDVFYTLTGKSAETDTSEGDYQTKIRIHGSRKKGVIIQSDVVASNGMIHFINKLMDSVSPTVDSDTEVQTGILSLTDLTSVIDSPGVLTVFAPTTAAFDAMKEGQLQYLNSADGQIQVNDAAVLEAAVEGRNGRLYVLDGVLIPPSIEPILPHRCDVTENKGECTSCSKVKLAQCSSGVSTVSVYNLLYLCLQTAACCSGFFGADCSPCPGGYTTPCSGHGKCLDGLSGNGTCVCDPNFGGSRCHYCSSLNKYGLNCDKTCLCINGQCDNRPNSDGSCKPDSCLPGFTGRFCERQTAACGTNVQFCHAHALMSPYKWRALHLFFLLVFVFCSFFRCVCKPGFNGDGITCVESDPCAPPLRGGCSVNAKCIKTGVGTHTCQCLSGWREDGDDCQPINNCDSPDNGGCHPNATCIYVGPGQWKCVCDDGYTGNGQICYGTVEQVRNMCTTFTQAVFTCKVTTVGGATITTPNIAATNGLIHIIDKVLVPDRKLSEGLLATLALRPDLSLFRSYIIKYNLTDEIQQTSEFTVFAPTDDAVNNYLKETGAAALDVNTTRYHVLVSESLLKTDLQQGGYKPTLLGFSFHLGIFPRDGKLFVNDAQINSSNILCGKGVIHTLSSVLLINRNRCDSAQYQKVMGPCEDCLFPRSKICPNNTKLVRKRKCMLSRVFEEERLLTIGCRATCYKTNIIHKCCAGFFGEHCEPCPGPKGQPCFGNGACSDGINGTGVCGCFQGFNGTACETCQSGKYGVHCDQGCKCKNGRCNEGLKGDGTCECDVGWRGILCDETDELCGSVNCVFRPSGLQCLCAAGFEGNGTFCQAKDPCAWDNGGCSLYAVCKRTRPGQRQCVCNSGYTGDGLVCVEVNPCLEGNGGCHVNADCVHVGPNKTSCACSEGYEGDGQTCNMIDLCRKKNGDCHKYARCNMTGPGVRTCTCMSYYIGDGVTCKGTVGKVSKIVSLLNHSKVVSLNQLFTLSLSFFYLQDDTYVFQDTGVVDLVQDAIHQPITIFLPSDAAMASLPQQQKDFLFNPQNQAQLQEYLKYHILPSLIHLDSPRTIQGSPLSFSCGGLDAIGDIFVNDGKCRIVQRHLIFREGIAYGIDCLLTPPSLGGRCDEQSTFDFRFICIGFLSLIFSEILSFQSQEVQRCDLPTMFVTRNSGCRSTCTVNFWQPKCCPGYYGRDCLVCPGGVGSPCNNRGKCDDGHLGNGTCTCNAGFGGVACELCNKGFYGPTCKACNCSEHGSCDDGRRGTGSCFCEAGWTGERCETPQAEVYQCSPACSPKAVCQQNNTCVCRPFYVGDGLTCTVVDMCQVWNGGCAKDAKCSQKGEQVSCTCPKGYTGDGYVCLPIDPCADGNNGGCHEHAICTLTAPGKRKCSCKDKYIGDGVTCDVKQLPISRCLQDNGLCHQDAKCTDLHFEDATLGVFHLRSDKGQYKLNYTAAQQACSAVGGTLATYMQLSYAQQGGLNMCAAGWLDQARVSYPTTYANPNCGFGHVGIVDYGVRKNLSETWDTFCYRMKEVKCECKVGYIGDGFTCTGNLLQVLKSTPSFSSFLTQILNYSEVSASGKQFMKRLSNLTIQSTLFVPDNSGLAENDTLTQRDIEFHLSDGQVLPINRLKNGTRIRTRVGSLTALGVSNLLNPAILVRSQCNFHH
uniref:Stabilin 2 n=1 Tax=Sphaeramia orbicularis TaxID=375764 RepID=A0A673BC57_9TELE